MVENRRITFNTNDDFIEIETDNNNYDFEDINNYNQIENPNIVSLYSSSPKKLLKNNTNTL